MRCPNVPWPLRSVLVGMTGTAAMAFAYRTEHRLRPAVQGPVDYDDSLIPGEVVATILHHPSVTGREEHELGSALQWGYGSAFGVMHGLLRRRLPEPWASLVFEGMLMTATFSLFPILGRTPPPWRWPAEPRDVSLLEG